MTLPVSGAISLNQVNVELGLSGTTTISMNQASVRTLFGVPSGAISMSNGYGKANQFSFTIGSNQTNANLRTLAVAAGWPGTSKVIATISGGVQITSNSTGTPALTINGSFPNGVQLTNNGTIVGRGGAGGAGGSAGAGSPYRGANGNSGGTGVAASVAVTIYNNTTIGGGGGGGGGGGLGSGLYDPDCGGGGGGGGAGFGSGAAGGVSGANSGFAGSSGTLTSGGGGGAGFDNGSRGGAGGGGGPTGSSGGGGAGGTYWTTNTSSGGGGGNSITGNANITWGATGTRIGAIS